MTKAINFKLASLICAASLASVGSLTPAAKAIEVDPNPNDGKCYFIENDLTLNYNEGTEYAAILNANPWIGNSEITEEAARLFNKETSQNWRFAWKATSGNNNKGQADALNTWYWVRQGEGNPHPLDNQSQTVGFYTTNSKLMQNFAQGFEYACPGSSVGEGVFDGLKIPGLIKLKINANSKGLFMGQTIKELSKQISDLGGKPNLKESDKKVLIKNLNKQLETLSVNSILQDKTKNKVNDEEVKGVKIRFQSVEGLPPKELRKLVDKGKKDLGEGIVVEIGRAHV